jgi:hypothetical protein
MVGGAHAGDWECLFPVAQAVLEECCSACFISPTIAQHTRVRSKNEKEMQEIWETMTNERGVPIFRLHFSCLFVY